MCTLALLLAFLVIQAWGPLLHAHVRPGGTATAGIHLPDGSAIAHGHQPAAFEHGACDTGDGAMVTAPAEHRRDDAKLLSLSLAPAARSGPSLHRVARAAAPPRAPDTVAPKPDNPPPLPAGPPALA